MSNKILILGASSFVAVGFKSYILQEGYEVDEFGRKNGSYLEIDRNKSFASTYNTVINFAVLKDQSIEDNVKYIEALLNFCCIHKVKKLIHFSSIMVYSRKNKNVDELTPIESPTVTKMRGYGQIKCATDEYLDSVMDSVPFEIIRVRPGFVLSDDRACPFIKKIGSVKIILGDKHSTLPLVQREDIHKALLHIIKNEKNLPVYLFFSNDGITKYLYAKKTVGGLIFTLPKLLFDGVPFLFAKMRLIPWSFYSRFEGMFTSINYSSKLTEDTLQIKFK